MGQRMLESLGHVYGFALDKMPSAVHIVSCDPSFRSAHSIDFGVQTPLLKNRSELLFIGLM